MCEISRPRWIWRNRIFPRLEGRLTTRSPTPSRAGDRQSESRERDAEPGGEIVAVGAFANRRRRSWPVTPRRNCMAESDWRRTLLDSYENAAVIVSGIVADELGDPTPCPKYDVAGLIDHLVEAGHRAAALGRGQAPPPGDRSPHVELCDAPGQLRSAAEE